MRVLVTGGAGFIGSAVCRHAVEQLGWTVIAVDKLTYAGHLSSLATIARHDRFRFVRADICDREAMNAIFREHAPDAVLHLAAESHVDRSISDWDTFIRTNIVGTATLLDTALAYYETLNSERRANFRFHHVSTDEIYGTLGPEGRFAETSPMAPRSPYAASKAASDHLVAAWGHTYGLPVLVSNCSNNYGPYQFCEKLIPLTILNALEWIALPVYGDGLQIRDWLHVDDHVRALVLILLKGRPGEVYNVGARNERTNISVVEAICDILDARLGSKKRRALIQFVADRPGHDRRYAVDPTKLETALGWAPLRKFEQGLEETVTWYLENRDWWQPLRNAGHGKSRLGLPAKMGTALAKDDGR